MINESTIQAEIDLYLDQVDAVLIRSNIPRAERQTICDDITGQVLEKLAARCETAQVSDIQAVISELDPPESYGDGTTNDVVSSLNIEPARLHPMAIAAACTMLAGSALHVLALTWVNWQKSEADGILVLISFCLISLLAIFWGTEAIKAMCREPKKWHGYGMAFLMITSLPSLLLILLFLYPAHIISLEARDELYRHQAKSEMYAIELLEASYQSENITNGDQEDVENIMIMGDEGLDSLLSKYQSKYPSPPFIARNSTVISLICYVIALGLGIPTVVYFNKKYYRKYKPNTKI